MNIGGKPALRLANISTFLVPENRRTNTVRPPPGCGLSIGATQREDLAVLVKRLPALFPRPILVVQNVEELCGGEQLQTQGAVRRRTTPCCSAEQLQTQVLWYSSCGGGTLGSFVSISRPRLPDHPSQLVVPAHGLALSLAPSLALSLAPSLAVPPPVRAPPTLDAGSLEGACNSDKEGAVFPVRARLHMGRVTVGHGDNTAVLPDLHIN